MSVFGRKRSHFHDAGKRTRPRSIVSLPGYLISAVRNQSVVLVDVSAIGAKVEGPNLPPSGEFVRLTVGNSTAFGSTVWSEAKECGIEFDRPLTDAEVVDFQQATTEAQRLGLSPDMMRARADWNNSR